MALIYNMLVASVSLYTNICIVYILIYVCYDVCFMLMSSPYDKYVQIYMVGLNRFGYTYVLCI